MGSSRPLASDHSVPLVMDQARASARATGTREGKQDPFKRSGIARTPPQRGPDATASILEKKGEAQNREPETEMQRLEREEKLAFEGLGKNIGIIDGIVKDARNIHKQIRDATTAAVIFYQRLREVREEKTRIRESHSSSKNEVQDGSKEPLMRKNRGTQTERRDDPKDAGVQTDPGNGGQSISIKENERKKRVASSPPEGLAHEKGTRARIASTRKGKLPAEAGEPSEKREDEAEWQAVEHRKKKRKKEEGNISRRTNRATRSRLPEAVAVKPKDKACSYADVLRNIKAKIDPAALGVEISKIRQTRGGELLIEIAKGAGKADELKNAVAHALGEDARVRNMKRSITTEIRDLDGATEENEVVNAIKSFAPEDDFDFIKVRALRKAFGETQVAIVTMPTTTADAILKVGKLRIGWIMCRIREKTPVKRCFRCFGFGHFARECKGPDRSKLCRLCGKEGHFARECKGQPLCAACNDRNEPGGAQHILGSSKCGSYRRGIQEELRK